MIIGLLAFIVLAISWTNALEQLPEEGQRAGLFGGGAWVGATPSEIAEKRQQINTTHGIWLIVILLATGSFFYIANEKDKKKKEIEKWWQKEGRAECDNLTADRKSVNSEKNVEKESYNYDEAIARRAKYLKSTRPMSTTSDITEELVKEGFDVDSEDQVEYILNITSADPTIINKQNNKPVNGSTKKVASDNLKEDVYESIEKLGGLLDKGYITQEEFDEKKKKLLDQV